MATGLPKTSWNSGPIAESDPSQSCGDLDVTLAYQGKHSEQEILATKPDLPSLVWSPEVPNGPACPNRLYYGDNLAVMASLLLEPSIRGQVRLAYIDPPFATNSVFQSRSQSDAYHDLLEGAHYVEFLRARLVLLRELLATDGSIYVHLDENMAFHMKIIMDEVFGRKNFRNWITRKKCNPKNYTRKTYGNVSDFILFYTKSDVYVWNRPVELWTPERALKEYTYVEESSGRRYKKVPVHAPGVRNGQTGKPWRGKCPPPGKHWQFPPSALDEMDARGEIYWSPNGNPRRKIYLDDSAGVPVQDLWLDCRDAHNQNIMVTGYPTEKNMDMLKRIIEASSQPGDLVLDCFCGSGTTLAAASHLERKWIGIDSGGEAIRTTVRRLLRGTERMGDFVKTPHTLQLEGLPELQNAHPSLFEEAEVEASATSTGLQEGERVTDFTVYANERSANLLNQELDEWEQWV